MKTIISGLLLLTACSSAMADDWIKTAWNDNYEFFMKKGSGELIKNKAGIDIYIVTGKGFDKKSKTIALEKWYVTTTDCLNKQGKLTTLSLDGNFKYENDFIFNGGSIASSNAELICSVYERQLNEVLKKGI